MSNVPMLPSVKKSSLFAAVEEIVTVKKVWDKVMPSFLNGGVCGHKVMDLKAAVDAVRDADTTGKLNPYNVNDFKLGTVLKNVVRSRVHLNSKWKVDGVNEKVAEQYPEAAAEFSKYLLSLSHDGAGKSEGSEA